jgi:hypothetical protein
MAPHVNAELPRSTGIDASLGTLARRPPAAHRDIRAAALEVFS